MCNVCFLQSCMLRFIKVPTNGYFESCRGDASLKPVGMTLLRTFDGYNLPFSGMATDNSLDTKNINYGNTFNYIRRIQKACRIIPREIPSTTIVACHFHVSPDELLLKSRLLNFEGLCGSCSVSARCVLSAGDTESSHRELWSVSLLPYLCSS